MIKHVVSEEHLAPIQVAVCALASVMTCFKCGQPGHVMTNCPQSGDPPAALPPQNRSKGPCWACGKRGHFAKECRLKKQGNGKGRGPPGRTQPSPTWDVRRPHYANPRQGGSLLNQLPPQGSNQLYGPANDPTTLASIPGTAGTTPWGRDPWVALAVRCDNPPVVWGICSLYNSLNGITISIPFLTDTGADDTAHP